MIEALRNLHGRLVLPKTGVDTALLAARINTIDGLHARDPAEITATVGLGSFRRGAAFGT